MSSLQVPDAFIFDLDGVIIDSEPLHEQALREACSEYDTSLSERILDEFRGQPDRAIVRHLIQETNASSSVEHILAAKREIYGELVDQLTLIPGVLNFIQTLNNRDFPMAVVTSSSRSD